MGEYTAIMTENTLSIEVWGSKDEVKQAGSNLRISWRDWQPGFGESLVEGRVNLC